MKKSILIFVLPLAIVATILAAFWWFSAKTITIEDVDRSIRTEVPQRASTSEVGAWFKQHDIIYKYESGSFAGSDFVARSGIPAKNIKSSVSGVMKDTSRSFVEDCDIYIAFYFDQEDKLIKHHIEELCSGL